MHSVRIKEGFSFSLYNKNRTLETPLNPSLQKLFLHWSGEEITSSAPLAASGSNRQYFRIKGITKTALGVLNPDFRENTAFVYLAGHFATKGISVPAVLAEDLANHTYLVEDLGDVTLYDLLSEDRRSLGMLSSQTKSIYQKVVRLLPKLQVTGDEGLDYTQCYPRASFDEQSMFWDLNYFKYYFVKLAGISFDEQKLEDDFRSLAAFLLAAGNDTFLYRDFQSRNIMVCHDEPWFIDFQGGRRGALQYDLASLLFDGKADLSPAFREELLNHYLQALQETRPEKAGNFMEYFYPFVYIRIIQAMGAYGFRGFYERKLHFLQSIPYALRNLEWLMTNAPLPLDLPELTQVFRALMESETLKKINTRTLKVSVSSFSYKHGLPADDSGNGGGFIFDCRALPNPGRYPEYQALNGKDKAVIDYLESFEEIDTFFLHVVSLVRQSIDNYLQRGFTSLSVSFGCTGGQHRSVYFAERLAAAIRAREGVSVVLAHREQKESPESPAA